MREWTRVVAGCCAAAIAGAVVVHRVRLAPREDVAAPDLAWLAPTGNDAALAPVAGPKTLRLTPFAEGPTRFEPNLGQSDAAVRFVRRGPSHATFLEDSAFTTVVARAPRATEDVCGFTYRVRFDGAADRPAAIAEDLLPGVTNYFIGSDESSWVRGVPSYARVRYAEVWPGVEVVFHGVRGAMEYDFVVAPGADAGRIALAIEGAESCTIDAAGDLVLTGAGTEMRHRRPRIVQRTGTGLREIDGAFAMDGPSRVRIRVGEHDPSLPLVIDPVIGVRAGGEANDSAASIAVSSADIAALLGQTPSVTFLPAIGPLHANGQGMSDAFAATYRLATGTPVPNYTAIVASPGDECFTDGQFAPNGSLYLVGFASALSGYPIVNASQTTAHGGQEGTFVVIDGPGANLLVSGGIGGTNHDIATTIALLPGSPGVPAVTVTAAVIGLATRSTDIPFVGTSAIPTMATPGGLALLRYSPAGVPLGGTYLPGNSQTDESLTGLFITPLPGTVGVVCGYSTSGVVTTTGIGFQNASGGGARDGYVVRLGSSLSTIISSSYVTGPQSSFTVTGITARPGGGILVCGTHQAGTLPVTPNAALQQKPGLTDGALFHLNDLLTQAPLVAFVGGPGVEDVTSVLCPVTNTVYVAGTTFDGLVEAGGGDAKHGSLPDMYVRDVSLADGTNDFLTHVGSVEAEFAGAGAGFNLVVPVGRGLAQTSTGIVLVAGTTPADATELPLLTGPVGGGQDPFLQSVTGTALGAAPRFELLLSKGDLTDSAKPRKDSLHVRGTFDPGVLVFDVAPGGTESITFGLHHSTATFTAEVFERTIALDEPGWRATRGGDVLTYKSPRGESPVVSISLNFAAETFKFDVTKLDFPAFPVGAGRFDVGLTIGDAESQEAERWELRRPGSLWYRPLTAANTLTGDLAVTPSTVMLNQPFMTNATLWNRGDTPLVGTLRFLHRKFEYVSWSVTVPGRDPVTLEPGVRTVGTSVTVPSAGRNQLFRVFFDDRLLDSAKAHVTKP